jgi:LPXTG-motif cell wall-anchored protein
VSTERQHRKRATARFAGVLLASAVAGTGVIASAGAAVAEEPPAATLRSFSPAEFTAQAAELPDGLVEAVRRDLGLSAEEYLANAAATKSASDVVAALEADGVGVETAAIAGQDVTIYVEATADVAAAEATGATVEVGEPASVEVDQEFTGGPVLTPKADHTGGYGYMTDDTDYFYRCSVGFSGTGPSGASRFLTAGHCGSGMSGALTNPVKHIPLDAPIFGLDDWADGYDAAPILGEPVPNGFHYGEGQDGGLVDITGDFTARPRVAGWGHGAGAPDDQAVNIYDTVDAVVGAEACKSGATSGWTCGAVLSAEETVPVSDERVTGFFFDACMLGGDSGGSVVVGNYALGVNSGSTGRGTDCSGWARNDFGIGFAVTSGTENAEKLFGDTWDISIYVGDPVVSFPADGGNASSQPVFRGTAEAAAGAFVRVAIDGHPWSWGQVEETGQWIAGGIDGPPLEPGPHEYAVHVEHTARGASDATSSQLVTGTFSVVEQLGEPLVVRSPVDDETFTHSRPTFTGTGQPGATVSLWADDADFDEPASFAESTVAADGSWSLTSTADLPYVGKRFDAAVNQYYEGENQEVFIRNLGIVASEITIGSPLDGAQVGGDVRFSGTSFPGAEVSLNLDGVGAPAGEFVMANNGDWTFTPAEELEAGSYALTASATLAGGDPQLSDSEAVVSFDVVAAGPGDTGGDGDDHEGSGDLPDTGSAALPLIIGGIGLLVVGGAAIAVRRRSLING